MAKRQLAAIMFTDIVAYTSLMASDEEKALKTLRRSREIQKPLIEKYGGKWLKEMGDGVLAQFDSSVNAVNCALKIQKLANDGLDARIRIGIHLGDVSVEHGDVFGDGVNIASRIQAIADPGGIYISEVVNESVHSHSEIETKFLANIELKNVSRPLGIYCLRAEWLPMPSKARIQGFSKERPSQKYRIGAVVIILLVLLGWYITGNTENKVQSVVVLPISNLSGDQSKEILLAGLHSELRDEIASISALRVISRTSSSVYRNVTKSVPEIASELQVDAIVESELFQSGDSIRLEVRLIKAFPAEEEIWNDSFYRSSADIPIIFNRIATSIARETEIGLTEQDRQRAARVRKVDPQAYEFYLAGLSHLYKATKRDLDKALDYFDRSIELDQNFAPAHFGVAHVWGFRIQMGYLSYEEASPYMEKYTKRAFELDSTITEAHYAQAISNTWLNWDWERAEKEYKITITMDPNHAEAHAYYAHYLNIMNRFDEAAPYMEKAMQLEPFNSWIQGLYGMYLNHTRQFEKARVRLVETVEQEPDRIALPALWTIYHNTAQYDKALEVAKQIYTEKREYVAVEKLITGNQEGGYQRAMEYVAEAFILKMDTAYVTPWQIATLYTRADNQDKAVEWLWKAYEVHDVNMPYISCDPIFDNIEGHSRFQELLIKMGLVRERHN